MNGYQRAKNWVITTYGVYHNEEMFQCPECDEPILEEDYGSEFTESRFTWTCPICGFNWITERYDKMDEDEEDYEDEEEDW